MPLPKPKEGENQKDYVSRFMENVGEDFDSKEQKLAVAYSTYRDAKKSIFINSTKSIQTIVGNLVKKASSTQVKAIESILSNDESSSDAELVRHFVKEIGVSEQEAKRYISRRTSYLNGAKKSAIMKADGYMKDICDSCGDEKRVRYYGVKSGMAFLCDSCAKKEGRTQQDYERHREEKSISTILARIDKAMRNMLGLRKSSVFQCVDSIKKSVDQVRKSAESYINRIIDGEFTHEEKKCAYGHQIIARKIAREIINDASSSLRKNIENEIGNEFDLRHYVEGYLDDHCKFLEK